ncbi:MAG: hypothetical protein JXR58_11810 [Bacteroidales bacterium]|nr:hypothetical protein [Bacteroidales bacterium]
MKKVIFIVLFAGLMFSGVKAQDYNTGVGLRGGFATGLTIKHFTSSSTAFEGIIASRWHGFSLTGLVEFHKPAFDVDRLNWYWGFGAHLGFWNNTDWYDDNDDYMVIGIDGILGIEYNFEEAPINISIDWKPAFHLVGYSGFGGDEGAVSIRYIF